MSADLFIGLCIGVVFGAAGASWFIGHQVHAEVDGIEISEGASYTAGNAPEMTQAPSLGAKFPKIYVSRVSRTRDWLRRAAEERRQPKIGR